MQFICKFQHKERVPVKTKYAWHQDYLSIQKTFNTGVLLLCTFPHAPTQDRVDDLEIKDLFGWTKWRKNIVFTRIKANSKYLKTYYTLSHFLLSHMYCLYHSQIHRQLPSHSFGGYSGNLFTIHSSWLRNIFLSLFLSTWYADII